ncbi:MAG: bacterial Ig-like domain-containing protein, partial [Oscillospiraceae bacterium]|nr:bacterial Ig-like domain-containing protein [Oscillospiraceae bacterium]
MVSGFDSYEAVTGQELTISYCGQTCSLFVDIEPLANGETFGTVELTLDDISEVFTTAFTEGLVQNALRTAVHADSEMYYIDSSNLWLDWIDHEHGDSVSGIGEGTEMMSMEKDYLFGLSIFARDGYVFEDEISLKINGEEASVFSVTRFDWGITIETPAPKVTEAAVKVTGIEVNSHAHKTVYVTTEELDVTDLTILARKSDGSAETVDVTADMVSGFDSSVPVTGQVLTVTYGGQTCTYTVDIKPLTGQTIGTVELTLDDISHLFTTTFTEGLVQNALRT